MVNLTQSLEHFLSMKCPEKLLLILFGHVELLTPELQKEYFEWCKTDEGKQYLKGGSLYDENHRGNKAIDKMVGESK